MIDSIDKDAEQRGYIKGMKQMTKNLLDVLDDETIAKVIELKPDEVKKIRSEVKNNDKDKSDINLRL